MSQRRTGLCGAAVAVVIAAVVASQAGEAAAEDAKVLSVSLGSARPLVALGAGNVACWQNADDGALADLARRLGGWVGRFPGGTVADYYNHKTGLVSMKTCPNKGGGFTPDQWGGWSQRAGLQDSVWVVNQLTANLSDAVSFLQASEAAGGRVRYVELGNEMTDGKRADVVKMYPTGQEYAKRMVDWTATIKELWPEAQVSLVALEWKRKDEYNARHAAWNREVLQGPMSKQADAATIHIYAGDMPRKTSGIPEVPKYAEFLQRAWKYVDGNKQYVRETIPDHLSIWVTELGVFPNGPLDNTWLQAMYHVTLMLGLFEIERIAMMLPWCLTCRATAPMVQKHNGSWRLTNRGLGMSMVFEALRGAQQMRPLTFGGAQNLRGRKRSSMVGWLAEDPAGGDRMILVNTGHTGERLHLGDVFGDMNGRDFTFTRLQPPSLESMVDPSVQATVRHGDVRKWSCLRVPGFSMTLVRVVDSAARVAASF